jgi:hypothetical protein
VLNPSEQLCLIFAISSRLSSFNSLKNIHSISLENIHSISAESITNVKILLLKNCSFLVTSFTLHSTIMIFECMNLLFEQIVFTKLEQIYLYECSSRHLFHLNICSALKTVFLDGGHSYRGNEKVNCVNLSNSWFKRC